MSLTCRFAEARKPDEGAKRPTFDGQLGPVISLRNSRDENYFLLLS